MMVNPGVMAVQC